MHNDYAHIAEKAKDRLASFSSVVAGIPYEEKGVLYSEVLFMLACIGDRPLKRILESGRARGQSTLLLARALPDTEIMSFELYKDSPDAPIAEARLREYRNVRLLYGNAREELPRRVAAGDIVIIDGPKMFLAIRLALKLLATKKVAYVFVHDVSKTTPERAFLDRFMPECRFSDNRTVAEVTHVVDHDAERVIPGPQRLGGFSGDFGYGFSLAAMPYVKGRSYRLLWAASILYDLCGRITRKFGRMLSHRTQ